MKTLTETRAEANALTKIQAGQVLKARSVGDYDCIFEVQVIGRTGKMAVIEDHRDERRRTKIYVDERGEYLRPDRWSFAPTFRPDAQREFEDKPVEYGNVIAFPQHLARRIVEDSLADGDLIRTEGRNGK